MGFTVQRTGRFTEEYRENSRSITIDVESGVIGGRHLVSYRRASFDAWSSNPVERQRAIDNFGLLFSSWALFPMSAELSVRSNRSRFAARPNTGVDE
ncbi:hypothetical protein P7B03_16185 [Lysobacter soli]|nr:hypothetical protein [Lysobacter soli]